MLTLAGELDESGEIQEEPWHFLATLRLDGRAKFEKRAVISLDRNFGKVSKEDGEVFFTGAKIRDENGAWKEYAWVFKDVGVDITFENLQLGSQNQGAILVKPEEDLADAFGAMSATKKDQAEEKSTVGQIEVRFDKIALGEWTDAYIPDPEKENEMKELRGSEVGGSEHTVGRSNGTSKPGPKRSVYFNCVEKGYAVFRFKYCDESMFVNQSYFMDNTNALHRETTQTRLPGASTSLKWKASRRVEACCCRTEEEASALAKRVQVPLSRRRRGG